MLASIASGSVPLGLTLKTPLFGLCIIWGNFFFLLTLLEAPKPSWQRNYGFCSHRQLLNLFVSSRKEFFLTVHNGTLFQARLLTRVRFPTTKPYGYFGSLEHRFPCQPRTGRFRSDHSIQGARLSPVKSSASYNGWTGYHGAPSPPIVNG